MKFLTVLPMTTLFALLLVVISSAALCLDMRKVTKQYEDLIWLPVTDWRLQVGDIPEARQPEFDDSSWAVVNPEYDWGTDPVAWLRKTLVVPRSMDGDRLALRIGIDDHGELFVNGESVGRFGWDRRAFVLTENAKAGDEYHIAIKGINTGGPGRLLSARMEHDGARSWIEEGRRFRTQFEVCQQAAELEEPNGTGPLHDTLKRAEAALDLAALDAGQAEAFEQSVPKSLNELLAFEHTLKSYTLSLIGHGHIDMNWLWLWPETVDVCKTTFTSATNLMKQYPGFRYSQSQPSTYVAMQEADAKLFRKIQLRAKDSLWEITGGTWVEGDMNMASGESIVRQILYAKRYFRKWFGFEPRICWSPDTFGHAWTIPQILRKGEIDYYYHCRCGKGERLFWWEGPEGSRVLAYNDDNYSAGVRPESLNVPFDTDRRYGVKRGMLVYGVGDHGGGPTKESIEQAIRLRERRPSPTIKFDRAEWYYDGVREDLGKADLLNQKGPANSPRGVKAAATKPGLPVIRDELNYEFQGCYTTHSDIKKSNRDLENLLPTAEAFNVLSLPFGGEYDSAAFEAAWQKVCFNQFHDIFDGSAIHGSYDYSAGLADAARKTGQKALKQSLQILAKNVDTKGDGKPVVVFNPSSWTRSDAVCVPLSKVKGEAAFAIDAEGNEASVQEIGGNLYFTAESVPAFGYKVYWLKPAKANANRSAKVSISEDGNTLENEFFRICVDRKRGTITSIYDKRAKRQVLPKGAEAGVLQILWEKPHRMSAWYIGEIEKTTPITQTTSAEITANSPAMAAVKLGYEWSKSKFTQEIRLYKGVPRIDIKFTADWQDLGNSDNGNPMLKVAFPVNVDAKESWREIPFGAISHDPNGDEIPAQKWIDVSDANYGVSLLNDSKYGHDVRDNVLRLTLLRAPYDPDPTPDQGKHEVTYSLYPHADDWRAANSVLRGYELNNPMMPVVATSHSGKLPKAHSFLNVDATNVVVTAVKKAEDRKSLIVRLYESAGRPTEARVSFGGAVARWREVNLLERASGSNWLRGDGHGINVKMGPWEIKTLEARLR